MSPVVTDGKILLRSKAAQTVADSLQRIRQHPFILKANAQMLTQEQAERWILCAGRESRSFPQILENMVARCSNEQVKSILAKNLADEYGSGNPEEAHFKHYLQLLDELHIPRETFDRYKEGVGIRLALSVAYNTSIQENEAVAIGYMLVNEDMTQITYSAIQKALQRYYPLLKTPFFALHVDIDAEHVEDLYGAIDALDLTQADALLFGIGLGERGMAVLLDEVYGVFDYCDVIPVYDPVG